MGIGIRPDSKKQGIGSQLVEYVVNVAGECGFQAVDASVFADNTAMLRLLLKLNFIPVNMSYNRRADGADIVRMKKFL